MVSFAGSALRLTATITYALAFLCAAIVLGIYSYFLARLSANHLPINTDWKATEGLAGAAVLYTIFATLLTCFLGGIKVFAFLGVFLDVLFTGAFLALAVLTKDGASSCKGTSVETPLGNIGYDNYGFPVKVNTSGYSPNLHLACRLNTASFAVAIIGAFLMVVSAVFQILIARNHQKEKYQGPSPDNAYGKKKFWQRKRRAPNDAFARDVEVSQAPPTLTTGTAADLRPSYDTTTTNGDAKFSEVNPYESGHTAGAYHTAPRGTAVGSTNF